TANTMAYGGTHDNDTLMGYYSSLEPWELGYIKEYLRVQNGSLEDIVNELFRVAYASVANVVIFQMQDVLKIGNNGRMNQPASMGTNWRWRLKSEQFGSNEVEFLRYLSDIYGR
ncbi:MAG: 4-alpha-glucanotransferase, partial [Lachnospiraceae bacterium]|nr:4-alpha-glucanotransferase [Lachnospiraceae bacterium]